MSQNTGPGFSNVQNVPTVQQPSTPTVQQRIMFNKKYLASITGILRIALIVTSKPNLNNLELVLIFNLNLNLKLFQFAAWISAAAVLKPNDGTVPLPSDLAASRSAYLFFSIVGFVLAIVLFLMNVLNIVSLGFLNRLPWGLIVILMNLKMSKCLNKISLISCLRLWEQICCG